MLQHVTHGIFGPADYKTHLEQQLLYSCAVLLMTKEIFVKMRTEDVRMLCFKKEQRWVMYIGRDFLIKQLASKQR